MGAACRAHALHRLKGGALPLAFSGAFARMRGPENFTKTKMSKLYILRIENEQKITKRN
jgi:hypothetical protein